MTIKPHAPPSHPSRRRPTYCTRHPHHTLSSLCAPCLRERLSLLTPSADAEPSKSSASASSPELRRCRTYSGKKREGIGVSYSPRRRSCEVSSRGTLSTLFDLDDERDSSIGGLNVESKNLGFLRGSCVAELKEEGDLSEIDDEIRVSANLKNSTENLEEFEGLKMKEYIDLEFMANKRRSRDFKDIAGSFRVAASVFSKKLQKWRRNQKSEKRGEEESNGGGGGLGQMRLEDLRGRRLRETQSEVGEYGFGRRSCDADPRRSVEFGRASIDGGYGRRSCDSDLRGSVDLGRASVDCGMISVDEKQGSFDAPRASWDGYLMGSSLSRGTAPMVSVIENAMATVYGFDNRALVAGKMKTRDEEEREISSLNRSKDQYGFDRSNSKRNVVVTDDSELKSALNAKVSPATVEIFHGTKLLITEKELNDWRLNALKDDDSSESYETASRDVASVSSSSNGKGFKKCRQWSKLWSIMGLLHRRKYDKADDTENLDRGNEQFPHPDSSKTERDYTAVANMDPNQKLTRSYSVASSRSEKKSHVKRQENVVLERNRSARYSPNTLDNGLLRFYLTPLRSRRRSNLGKSRLKKSHSLARSVLRL